MNKHLRDALIAVPVAVVAVILLWPVLRQAVNSLAVPLVSDKGPPPALFGERLTFDQAVERGRAESRPVFAVFSAVWCAPCRAYKKGALSDERVAEALRGRMIPVYVDVDQQPDAARRYKVRSIPMTMVLKGDERIRGAIGALSTNELLKLIDESLRE